MPTQVFYSGKGFDMRYVGLKFTTIARNGDIQTKNALHATAEWTLAVANTLVPFKDGYLQRSGKVHRAKDETPGLPLKHKGRNVSVVTFGDSSVRYAILQHEGFFIHPNGRIRLYLKVALDMTTQQDVLKRAMMNGLKTVAIEKAMFRTLAIP